MEMSVRKKNVLKIKIPVGSYYMHHKPVDKLKPIMR